MLCCSNVARSIRTQIGTVKQLDPGSKPATAFFQKLQICRRGQSSKFDLILAQNHVLACRSDSAGPTWTKIGTVKQLDPGNKPVMAPFRNLQI